MEKHISYDSKCKFNRKCKKCYSWNPSTCICECNKYLKRIASAITCDEINHVMDSIIV